MLYSFGQGRAAQSPMTALRYAQNFALSIYNDDERLIALLPNTRALVAAEITTQARAMLPNWEARPDRVNDYFAGKTTSAEREDIAHAAMNAAWPTTDHSSSKLEIASAWLVVWALMIDPWMGGDARAQTALDMLDRHPFDDATQRRHAHTFASRIAVAIAENSAVMDAKIFAHRSA